MAVPALTRSVHTQKGRSDPQHVARLAEAHDMYFMVDPDRRIIYDLG